MTTDTRACPYLSQCCFASVLDEFDPTSEVKIGRCGKCQENAVFEVEHEFPLWCMACGQALGDHDICYGCGTYYSRRVEPTPDELGPCLVCGQELEETDAT